MTENTRHPVERVSPTTAAPLYDMRSTPGTIVTIHADGRQTEDAACIVHAPDEAPQTTVTVHCLGVCAGGS